VGLAGELLRLRGVRNRQIPPFTLEGTTDYPARLDVAYPDHLNRWLVLVEWILTVPHPMVVGILIGGGSFLPPQYEWAAPWSGWDLITILAVVPAVMLLSPVTTPGDCSNLLMGLDRWVYRVLAYMPLMTDQYPRSGWIAEATSRDWRQSARGARESTLTL
jgi:hypothetical protein